MRVAMLLDDRDVVVLRHIREGHKGALRDGRVKRMAAQSSWHPGPLLNSGISTGELESICSKLAGCGLIRPTEKRNVNDLDDSPVPYGLLQKGADFVTFVASESRRP